MIGNIERFRRWFDKQKLLSQSGVGQKIAMNWLKVVKHSFPPKSKFDVGDVPDLSGQVIIVTGGNTGIGKETVKVSTYDPSSCIDPIQSL
jgi:hypothetical protein